MAMDIGMLGAAAGFALLIWILAGQSIRRIRSSGQRWLYAPLCLAAVFPILFAPVSLALLLWPEKHRSRTKVHPARRHRSVLLIFVPLLGVAIVGLPLLVWLSANLSGP